MKILVVAYDVSSYSSGASVNKVITEGLVSKGQKVAVLASRVESSCVLHSRLVTKSKYILNSKLTKLLIIVIGRDLRYLHWIYSAFYKNCRKIAEFEPDIVYALADSGRACVLELATKIAKKLNKPLAIHLVDPIPPSRHYITSKILHKRIPLTIIEALKYTSLLTINNKMMLEYQQKNTNCEILSKSIVMADPIIRSTDMKYGPTSESRVILSYLGSFNTMRTPRALIEGFAKYNHINPNSELNIIGYNIISLDDYDIGRDVRERIKLIKWTVDLESVYKKSTILVDIDANAVSDVLISHKIKQYLTIDRVILAITCDDSPSAQMFGNLVNSVVICNHSPGSVEEGIKKAANIKYNPIIFKEREILVREMNVETAMGNLMLHLEKIKDTQGA